MPPAFPGRSASHASPVSRPYNPGRPLRPPVWAPPRSLAATWGIISYFLLLRVLRCFSSPRVPPLCGYRMSPYGGLPHSEIPGSKVICTSPGLIAAYHVLRRRQEPGHPLCALSNLLVSTRFDFSSSSRPASDQSVSRTPASSSSSLSKNSNGSPRTWRITDSNR